jgi:hypothetical protein
MSGPVIGVVVTVLARDSPNTKLVLFMAYRFSAGSETIEVFAGFSTLARFVVVGEHQTTAAAAAIFSIGTWV